MILIFFIFSILIQKTLSSDLKLEDVQFKKLVFEHFSKEGLPKLKGIHLFKIKKKIKVQVDIEVNDRNLKKVIYQSYKALYELSNFYFQELHTAHVIFHFKSDDIPILTSANINCLARFFNKPNENFSNWENNCLDFGSI